ncbi:hypothetical protein [Leucobacter salsicius]|uniref:hypothetical protein n=1 Tax=Leucobacter salsicius TaxID=664638 RepID=UPI000374D095|nr:hypothetical protein [Leucobacter salsicius]
MTTNIFRGRAVATLTAAALAITALTSCSTAAAPKPSPKPAVEQPAETPTELTVKKPTEPASEPVQERIAFPEGESTMTVQGAEITCEPDPETGAATSVRTVPVPEGTPNAVATDTGEWFTYTCAYPVSDEVMKLLEAEGKL